MLILYLSNLRRLQDFQAGAIRKARTQAVRV